MPEIQFTRSGAVRPEGSLGRAARPGILSRRTSGWAVCALMPLFLGACQDGGALPLKNPNLSDPATATARLLEMDVCSDPPLGEVVLSQLFEAVNAERRKAGLSVLHREDTLMVVSDFYACRLADGGFFSHRDPFDNSTIDSRAIAFGYPFMKVGENLAAGQLSVEEVMEAWMASPGHRANILDPDFTEIGLAVKIGGADGPFWVQEFGRPSNEPLRTVRQATAASAESTATSRPVTVDAPTASQPGS